PNDKNDKIVRRFFQGADITVRTGRNGEILVSGFGVTQAYTGHYAKIIATGGEFGDRFDFSGLTGNVPVEADGRGGDDVLIDGPGNDTLTGGAGNDQLGGRDGNDVLDFGPGTNVVVAGADGPGNDLVDLTQNAVGVTFTPAGGTDTVLGSAFDDTITALP